MSDEQNFAVRKQLQDSNRAGVQSLRAQSVNLAMAAQNTELQGNTALGSFFLSNMQAPVSRSNQLLSYLTANAIPGFGSMQGLPGGIA